METSPPASKFRFRDHGDDMDNGESVVGDATSESSSVTSDEESDIDSDELTSMTAKGINHLCLELIELKQASEFDFQDNIISNYLSFIRVFKETEGINNEVMQLKNHIITQKELVRTLMDDSYLNTVSDDQTDTVPDESVLDNQNPTASFKACADEALETLNNLLFEHRLEEALRIFEMEDGGSPKVKFQEDVSPDVWMRYKSDMAEMRVMLADRLTLVAENPRVSAAELQRSLVGLSQLGFDHLATRLLLKYYHTRIASGVNNLQSSSRYLPGIYVHDLAKYVFSMISQASTSFVMLHGETTSYDSELMKWACEETEAFAACFCRHVKSISQIGDGLSMVVDSVHLAISYCCLLENQNLLLRPYLIERIVPCIEDTLKAQFDHFKKVISIFTSSDVWVMARYLVSGMLTDRSSSVVFNQHVEYCLLTDSGRKFVSLLQAVIEDVSSLVSIMGSSILEELVGLFTAYILILERALTYESNSNDVVEGESNIKMAESLSQKVSVFANLSTLEHFFLSMIRHLFKDINQLKSVIDVHMVSVEGTCSRLRTHFCKQYIHSIMSNEASCMKDHIDSKLLHDLMPSLPYQILFLELKKVEELAEYNVVEFDWLVSLLTELIETTFDWVSRNLDFWMISNNKDTTDQHSDRLNQLAFDMQFLVEIARYQGYLTTDMIKSSKDLVSQMESALHSSGFDHKRCVIDYEKVTNAAIEAIKELEALEEQKWYSDEESDQLDYDEASKEYQQLSSSNSVDAQSSSDVSFETTDTKTQTLDVGEDSVNKDSNPSEAEDETETNAVESGPKVVKRGGKLPTLSRMNAEGETCVEVGVHPVAFDKELYPIASDKQLDPVAYDKEQVSSTTSDELMELRKIRRVSKVVREQHF